VGHEDREQLFLVHYIFYCFNFNLHLTGQLKSRAGKVKDGMEQHALKNVNNCLYTNIYSYLETSGGICYNPYLNVVYFFNTRVN
jgi:hypothetical protein